MSACLLAASAGADPQPKPAKTPVDILKDQVCKEGAYVRPKPKKEAKPAASSDEKTDKSDKTDKTDKTPDAPPKLPSGDGGDFAPVGDTGMSKFTPTDGCAGGDTGFDKLFKAGPDGVVPADSLEIAPATKDGVPPGPERFTSLTGLTHLLENKAQSAELMKGFFDGSNPAALNDIKARADAADAAAAAALAEGTVAGDIGPKPLPEGMVAPKAVKLDDKAVPPPGSRKDPAIVTPPPPKTRFNPAAADVPPPAPAERSFFGGLGNDVSAVAHDIVDNRAGMISNEGFMPRSDATNAGAVPPVNSNPDPSITVPLPGAPIKPRDPQLAPPAVGINPNGCRPGCYGTARMISLLKSVGEQYSSYVGGKLNVGGISLYTGGPFPPHVSHRKGIDADISFVNHGKGFDRVENAMIVAGVVRALKDFHHINGVEYILCDQSKHAAIGEGLDYLVKQGILTQPQADRGKSVLVHWPNHNDHFHIRMR